MATPSDPKGVEDKFYEFKPFKVPKYQIKFKNAGSLSDIPGVVWYTPAALYAWGMFSDTNLSEIISREDLKVFWYKFDKPLFKSFGPEWNHLLWAAKEDEWKKLVDGVLETVQFDIPNKLLYQYALQSVTILDPLNVDKERVIKPDTPEVSVHAFAVLSNTGQLAFDSKKQPKGTTPGMVLNKPDPRHVRAARMLFKEDKLTRDEAFDRYKTIMKRLEDAAYNVDAQKAHEERIKREGYNERKS